MNLVGHVASAVDDAPPGFLAGCVLPDVAAIARVRLARPTSELHGDLGERFGAGVAFHHECDHVFHASPWFTTETVRMRDTLLAAGVDRGAARATAHAGLEMLLDGAFAQDAQVRDRLRVALATLDDHADALAPLAAEHDRARWVIGVRRIAASLDPGGYADPESITLRLQRMTAGRPRIEVRADQAARITAVLADAQPAVIAAAPTMLATVQRGVRSNFAHVAVLRTAAGNLPRT